MPQALLRPWLGLLVALCATMILAAPAASSASPGPSVHGAATKQLDVVRPPIVAPERYARDALIAGRALEQLGGILTSSDSLAEFRRRYARGVSTLARFRRAVERMGSYRLADARLNRQRASLARTGPPAARVLKRFLNAARRNDADAAGTLLAQVQAALTRLERASASPD